MQTQIIPNLWFDSEAEEAAKFYTSIFPASKIGRTLRLGATASKMTGKEPGTVLTVEFELNGNRFVGLNGGPMFKFNEAISFIVNCDTQEEIDRLWSALLDGGEEQACGWLKDRYGVSWQIVPSELDAMLMSADTESSERVMNAMLQMKKLDIAALTRAAEGA